MQTEVAKKETTNVAQFIGKPPSEQVLKSDVLLAKVMLLQALSEDVVDKKKDLTGKVSLESGLVIRSTTREIIGDPAKPIEIIPLTFTNTWMLQELVGKKYEFRGHEPRTAKNEALPWDYTEAGTQRRRVKVLTLFALIPADIEAEAKAIEGMKNGEGFDMEKVLLPVAIAFKNTSFNAGRSIATHFAKAQQMSRYGVKAYSTSLMLTVKPEKNDKGAYFVFGIEPGRKTPIPQYEKAEEWAITLASSAVKVDESDVDDGGYAPPPSDQF